MQVCQPAPGRLQARLADNGAGLRLDGTRQRRISREEAKNRAAFATAFGRSLLRLRFRNPCANSPLMSQEPTNCSGRADEADGDFIAS
jgi:hypothetical protein